jgi:hypothetical protein
MLVASSSTMNVVQHLQSGEAHLYFIIGGTLREIFLYFIKMEEAANGRFVVYNTYTGEISFSDKIRTDPNLTSIPVVEIKKPRPTPGGTTNSGGQLIKRAWRFQAFY